MTEFCKKYNEKLVTEKITHRAELKWNAIQWTGKLCKAIIPKDPKAKCRQLVRCESIL